MRELRVGVAQFVLVLTLVFWLGISQSLADGDCNWQFAGKMYMWGAEIGGSTSSDSALDIDFNTIIDDLDMVFMGRNIAPWQHQTKS